MNDNYNIQVLAQIMCCTVIKAFHCHFLCIVCSRSSTNLLQLHSYPSSRRTILTQEELRCVSIVFSTTTPDKTSSSLWQSPKPAFLDIFIRIRVSYMLQPVLGCVQWLPGVSVGFLETGWEIFTIVICTHKNTTCFQVSYYPLLPVFMLR